MDIVLNVKATLYNKHNYLFNSFCFHSKHFKGNTISKTQQVTVRTVKYFISIELKVETNDILYQNFHSNNSVFTFR